MKSKNKKLTAANAFWVLDAMTVIILGIRLWSENFYVYSHQVHEELTDTYWLHAGEIVMQYLPILIGLTLGGVVMTILAVTETKKRPPAEDDDADDDATQEMENEKEKDTAH